MPAYNNFNKLKQLRCGITISKIKQKIQEYCQE